LLVNEHVPGPATATTNSPAGTVEFASYAPKQIELNVNATAPSILLLNDKFDPDWKVWVDGKPAKLLRCNYLMRGVQVPAGDSKVRFHFEPSLTGFYVTLAAVIVGLLLCGLLFFGERGGPESRIGKDAEIRKRGDMERQDPETQRRGDAEREKGKAKAGKQ